MNERRFKVHGIPAGVRDDFLKLLLQNFFEVEKVYSIAQPNGKFQGQGFIVFWNKQEADRAFEIHEKEGFLKLEFTEEVLSGVVEAYDREMDKEELRATLREMRIVFPPQKQNLRPIKDIPFKEI